MCVCVFESERERESAKCKKKTAQLSLSLTSGTLTVLSFERFFLSFSLFRFLIYMMYITWMPACRFFVHNKRERERERVREKIGSMYVVESPTVEVLTSHSLTISIPSNTLYFSLSLPLSRLFPEKKGA